MNRAVQSDVVVVEVFPEAEWRAPANDVLDQNGEGSSTLVLVLRIDSFKIKPHCRMMEPKTLMMRMRKQRSVKLRCYGGNKGRRLAVCHSTRLIGSLPERL
jgi:hypothetical protein